MRSVLLSLLLFACSQPERASEPPPRVVEPQPRAAPLDAPASAADAARPSPGPMPTRRAAACARGTPAPDNTWTTCSGIAATLPTGETLCFERVEDACECKCGTPTCNVAESAPPQAFCAT